MAVFNTFGGIIPRTSVHALKAPNGTIAHNVNLRNGRLEPWRELCEFQKFDSRTLSFHEHGCCTVGWNAIVTAADVAPDWGRFYITGRTGQLEAVEDACCGPQYYIVGLPRPVAHPGISGTEECDRSADARTYVYTYLNKWGEESAPSPASGEIRVKDGSPVRLTGIALPPDGYGITHANIYRTATAFRQADGKEQTPMTEYLYVGTIEFPATSFTDNVKMLGLGPVLDTDDVTMPPQYMENICSIDVTTRLAGTHDNRVFFSEPFRLWSWPSKYELTLDSNIAHMVQHGMRLYVTTDTFPYVIDCSKDPEGITPVTQIAEPLPDIACVSDCSCIATHFGMFYSSPIGIILISPDGKWTNITSRWLGERDWAEVAPETVRLCYADGLLFIVTDKVSFVLNIDEKNWNDMQGCELTTISDKPIDMHRSTTGKVLMLIDNTVYVWNNSEKLRPYVWESGELIQGNSKSLWSPSTVKVRTNDTEFLIRTPRGTEYKRKVMDERPFRLPKLGRHLWYNVRLSGYGVVDFLEVGTANLTVNAGA